MTDANVAKLSFLPTMNGYNVIHAIPNQQDHVMLVSCA